MLHHCAIQIHASWIMHVSSNALNNLNLPTINVSLCVSPLEGARHIPQTQPLFSACGHLQRLWVNHRMKYSPQIQRNKTKPFYCGETFHLVLIEMQLNISNESCNFEHIICQIFLQICSGKVIVVFPVFFFFLFLNKM